MQKHPFIEFIPYRIVGIMLIPLLGWLYAWLLVLYMNIDWWVALPDSLITVSILALSGFLLWYATNVLRAIQAQIAIALLVQVVCIVGSFAFQSICMEQTGELFPVSLPLRLVFGLSCWVILLQWYRINQIEYKEKEEQTEVFTENSSASAEEDRLDRISVKDGARIHLIHLNELLYIQASGDYVTLFTSTGQYIKEQTMKYFETHLPPASFIRIHRSCIVSAEQIARVELFGKETYQVRLKNGACLRASNTGYRLLKERLSL